jgi:hypothetical protein
MAASCGVAAVVSGLKVTAIDPRAQLGRRVLNGRGGGGEKIRQGKFGFRSEEDSGKEKKCTGATEGQGGGWSAVMSCGEASQLGVGCAQ